MFRVVYADNPWAYDDVNTGGSTTSGAAQQYNTLDLAELKALPVRSIMSPAAICFMWVTTPLKFSHGGPCLEAWGFRYVTTVYWHKTPGFGMGRYFRGDFEELLVGVTDGIKPFGCQARNHIGHPPKWTMDDGEPSPHSSKPEVFRRLIEKATGEPSSRKNLELFGRRRVPGWTVLGNQIDESAPGRCDGLDIREAIRLEAVRLYGGKSRSDDHGIRNASLGESAGRAAGDHLGDGDPVGVV